MKIVDEPILFFSRVFSLKILFGNSLYFIGIKGIYARVRVEYEESVFQNRAD